MASIKITKSDKTYLARDPDFDRQMIIYRLRFHPTQAYLFAAVSDHRLPLWNLDGTEVKPGGDKRSKIRIAHVPATLAPAHSEGWIRALDVHPQGKLVATGGADRHLKLWAFADGKLSDKAVADVSAHDGWVESCAFSPDGKFLATSGSDKTVKLWSVPDFKVQHTFKGHTRQVRDVAWSGDGKHLISGGEDGKVFVWNGADRKQVHSLDFGQSNDQRGQGPRPSGVLRVAASKDGKYLSASGSGRTVIYNLDKGQALGEERDMQSAFHPTLPLFATGGNTAYVVQVDWTKLKPKAAPKKGGGKSGSSTLGGKDLLNVKLGDHAFGMTFDPAGKRLALGKPDGFALVYSITAS